MLFENPKNCTFCPSEKLDGSWSPGKWWGIIPDMEFPQYTQCLIEDEDGKLNIVSMLYMEVVRP